VEVTQNGGVELGTPKRVRVRGRVTSLKCTTDVRELVIQTQKSLERFGLSEYIIPYPLWCIVLAFYVDGVKYGVHEKIPRPFISQDS
jgi:hypothetical protein